MPIDLRELSLFQEGREEGREEGHRNVVLRLLALKLGPLPGRQRERISSLDDARLDALTDALLRLSTPAELEGWLAEHGNGG